MEAIMIKFTDAEKEELTALAEEYRKYQKIEKEAKETKETIGKRIKEIMNDRTRLETLLFTIDYKYVTKSKFDDKALQAEDPATYEKYLGEQTTRPLFVR